MPAYHVSVRPSRRDDGVFRQLVLARAIEPASKQDSLQVLEEASVDVVPYLMRTDYRRPDRHHRVRPRCVPALRAGRNSLVLAELTWQAPLVASDVVWWPTAPNASRDSAAVLIVSYNTRELTAFLLWSLRTIVSWPELEIVVVDNGSRDGSAQLLAEAERGGVCTLLANHGNRHHGPGLNQGISYLASRPGPRPAWIWILDSDVVAVRPDALSAAVIVAREHCAALVGEPQTDHWHPDGRFGQYSLLMDPAVAWQRQAGPFTDGGDPSFDMLTSATRLGIPMAPFPFTAAGYVIHRGRGSLAAVYAAGDRSHPFYEWAASHHEPHFAGVPGADQRYHALQHQFRQQTDPLTGATLAAACRHAPGHE